MYLYLLENIIIRKYYVGITDNIARRLVEHNSNNGHFTGTVQGEWHLVSTMELDRKTAQAEEKRLKKTKNKKYILWYFIKNGRVAQW